MNTVFLTGAPGTGKTTTHELLVNQGHASFDIDTDKLADPVNNSTGEIAAEIEDTQEWHRDHSWVLSMERVEAIRTATYAETIFFCGTVTDNFKFWDRFDTHIALMATWPIVKDRLITRTNHTFGKSQAEQDLVEANMPDLNARLIAMGAVIIDASQPKRTVLEQVINAAS